jgi:outer membrane protein TolC
LYLYAGESDPFTIDRTPLPTYVPDPRTGELKPNYLLDPRTGLPVTRPDGTPVFKHYAVLPETSINLLPEAAHQVALKVEQPLYLGGKLRAARSMAEIAEEVAGLETSKRIGEEILKVDEAFWRHVAVLQKVELAESYVLLLEELVASVRDSYEVEMVSRNQLLKAQVELNQAELKLQKARNARELSRLALCQAVGVPLETDIKLIRADVNLDQVSAALTSDESVSRRTEYKMLQRAIELKEENIRLVDSDFKPQIAVQASYGYSGLHGPEIYDSGRRLTALLSVSVPLFNWGERGYQREKAEQEKRISELELKLNSELMELEISKARFGIEDALKRVELTLKTLEQAKENLAVSQDRYEFGMETLTDLLEAQTLWEEARSDHIEALAACEVARSRYLKAVGRLQEDMDR